jgi:hypothetical protein
LLLVGGFLSVIIEGRRKREEGRGKKEERRRKREFVNY